MSSMHDEKVQSGTLPGLTPQELEVLKKVFSSPLDIPAEWKAWIVSYLEANPPQLPVSSFGWPVWKTWPGVLSSNGSTFALNNGTLLTRYVQLGKTVICTINFTCGSTTSFGTGYTSLNLPVTAANLTPGTAYMEDLNALAYPAMVRMVSTSAVIFYADNGALMAGGAPFTWGTGDYMYAQITYEAA